MPAPTLAEVLHLAEQLTPDEQRRLILILQINLTQAQLQGPLDALKRMAGDTPREADEDSGSQP